MSRNTPDTGDIRWTRDVLRSAGKILVYILALGMLSLMLAQLLMTKNHALRILLNAVAFGGVWALLFLEGGAQGQKAVAHDRMLAQRVEQVAEPDKRAGRYRPMRGALAALLAALPLFLAASALAVLAKPYTYALQDLPLWLAGYRERADIGAPLAYYAVHSAPAAADYLRIGVRLVIMPAAYIAGGFGTAASLLLDRLSPLLVLLLPSAFALGYLRGPALDRKMLARNEQAKAEHQKKIARKKKRERQRQSQGKDPRRLI